MKVKNLLLLAAVFMAVCATLCCCRKDTDPNSQTITIEREYLDIGTTSAVITGVYSYSGKIDHIKAQVGRRNDFADAHAFEADIDGTNFSVEITGLTSGTEYKYRYEVDYGSSKPFVTETKSFITLCESPAVRTLDVTSIDSTSVRINCEAVSDGGGEITERGVCWNTYGNPNLDDDTQVYAPPGLGLYSCRINGLAFSTKYYFRAYAKNASGIGFGEVLEFVTAAATQLPEVSTVEVNDVASTSAVCMGNVASDGGLELTGCGVCWSLNELPTTSGNHAAATEAALGVFQVPISGLTPNKTYHVRAYATNAKGTAYGADIAFTTTEGLPVVTTGSVTDITATSATCGGNVTDQGASAVTERGICWGTSHNPTTNGSHATNGTGVGAFTCEMSGLAPNQTYYVRAYARNNQGTAYGDEVSFEALDGLPLVTTNTVTDIMATTAKCGGNVTEQGASTVTERGICWATSHNPTINNSHADGGTGAGTFTCTMTGLTNGTTYYVRAYATNSQGTTYGNEREFTTTVIMPTVTTSNVTGITQTTATGGGNVTDDGGATVTECGICWSTSPSPSINDSHASGGAGIGSYTVNMTGLTAGTTYYVRAYATNSAGTSYGNQKQFITIATTPTVMTGDVSNVTQTSAQGNGNVTADGGAEVTARGLCWGTGHNPTLSGSHSTNGSGTGGFIGDLTGLTANTTYYVRAYATNSEGTSYGNEVSFKTSQNITAPTVTTVQVTEITQTTAMGGGNVTADGGATVTERGICWSSGHNPTTSGSHASMGSGTGSYIVSMTGLTAGTTYYVRAYAINSQGTSYGSEVSFTTTQNVVLPTVTTSSVTNIAQTTATGGGNVTNSGNATVTARGICWSTSHNPTTSNSHTTDGTGTGSFTSSITGLTAGTTYYVRAYAINSQGTSYGSEVSFTTAQNVALPTVTTSQVTSITQTTAIGGGNVTNSGNATVTERGICWSTSHNPTTSGSHVSNGTGTGSFTCNMTNLTVNTTYYVRAYAINSSGTAYGNEECFVTASQYGENTYVLVTSELGLESGAHYLLVGFDDDDNAYAMGYQKSNNRHAVSVIESSGIITSVVASSNNSQTDPFEFILGYNNGWSFFDPLNNGFLFSSGGGNYLRTQYGLTDGSKWIITFEIGGGCTLESMDYDVDRRFMHFNPNLINNAPLFTCYSSASTIQWKVYLFKAN